MAAVGPARASWLHMICDLYRFVSICHVDFGTSLWNAQRLNKLHPRHSMATAHPFCIWEVMYVCALVLNLPFHCLLAWSLNPLSVDKSDVDDQRAAITKPSGDAWWLCPTSWKVCWAYNKARKPGWPRPFPVKTRAIFSRAGQVLTQRFGQGKRIARAELGSPDLEHVSRYKSRLSWIDSKCLFKCNLHPYCNHTAIFST